METTICPGSLILLANSRDVDTTADQEIMFVGQRVESARLFRRKDGKLAKAGIAKPTAQFFDSMMILIFGSPPVECVADAVFVVWMSTEIDHLVQRPIDDWNATKDSSDVTEGREDLCWQSSRAGSQSAVDQFLPPLITSVEPDRKSTTRSDHLRDRIKNVASPGVVMHYADGEHEVERRMFKWQMLEVSLDKMDMRQMSAQVACLINGPCMVRPEHDCSRFAADFCIPSATTPGIQNTQAVQLIECYASLGSKGGSILVFMSDLERRPLVAKAFQMLIRDKPGNASDKGP